MKQRYFIELSYKGTRFHGWQVQPNAQSVQETFEHALSTICREPIAVTGAGRTDTGVHAAYYVAHFDAEKEDLDRKEFVRKLNRFFNADIAVWGISKTGPEAHARFSAVSRTYHYYIHQLKDPFLQEISWYYPVHLDTDKMNGACALFKGQHDFTSFSKLHTDVKTNRCTVHDARWIREGHRLVFIITADRFLRNMVRAIVGTMVMVGNGKIDTEDFLRIMELRDRSQAGTSVPPEGLFLTDIEYPPDLFQPEFRNSEMLKNKFVFPS